MSRGLRRDYYRKNYKNPFFSKKRKLRTINYFASSFSKLFNKFLIILMLAVIGSGFYTIFYSDYFKIKNIEINGNQNIKTGDIQKIAESQFKDSRFLIFKQGNIFFFNKDSLQKKITAKYILDKLIVSKKVPHTLKIELQEKTFFVVWVSRGRLYLLDLNGIVLSEASQELAKSLGIKMEYSKESEKEEKYTNIESKNANIDANITNINANKEPLEEVWGPQLGIEEVKNLPIIYDESNKEVVLKEKMASQELIIFIIELAEKLPLIDIEIVSFRVFGPQDIQVKAVTKEGWEIYFLSTLNLDEQIKRLISILEKEIQEKRNNLEYVDLRFGSQVYYKEK